MGGPCRLRIDCDDREQVSAAITAAESVVERLEARYSRYRDDSLLSQINSAAGGAPVAIDQETAALLRYIDTLWRQSDGLFDPTSGVLRRAWDFRSGRLPEQSAIDSLLPLVNWSAVDWGDEEIRLPDAGMEIDFGGCVKEYACDAVASRLRDLGLECVLIDLAGDMVALGPQADGRPWQIGIRHPREPRALATVPLWQGALASSGDYERCMVIDGRRYGHILDPRTGWPVNGLCAVSVLAEQCLVAGSGATVSMLHSEEAGLAWLSELGLPWLAVDSQLVCHGSIAQS